jgi:formate--tetrahydrofolate ligase
MPRSSASSPGPRPLVEVAADLGLRLGELRAFGADAAKLPLALLERPRARPGRGRLVLVSAITPTPAGEGKTTTSIGLGQALARLGASACLALRQPSQGPAFGVKGGATGGGRAHLVPQDRINLHFTGDFHAVTSAHNLLAALVDNHLHQGNALGIDPRRVVWRRVLDVNDRALRSVITGLGGASEGVPRETGFDITAASEVMAMLCLAEGLEDLRARLDRTLVAFTRDGEPVLAGRLGATGALLALLRDALEPNLVQTGEGTPVLVHGGPFANIAHGCSSVLATRMALHFADWCVTEAGFGFDLGAEKFFDIKCAGAGLDTAVVVLVATVRALKMHGGRRLPDLAAPDPEAVGYGLPNLEKHVENIRAFGEPLVVALNRFDSDTDAEVAVVEARCNELGVPFAVCEHFARGGVGAEALARGILAFAERRSLPFRPLYDWKAPVPEKIFAVASKMYGARHVILTPRAKRDLAAIERLGYAGLPVCIAKVAGSLSDDPHLLGRPTGFDVTVREIQVNAGAGFLVVLTGDILRMPGLPKHPLAERIDVDPATGEITGLR